MSYKEKQIIMNIIIGAAVLTAYLVNASGNYRSGALSPDDYRAWAVFMLKFVGIGALAAIVSQIVFHIMLSIGIAVKEKINDGSCDDRDIERSINAEMVEDERDKLISMKSQKFVFIFTGAGFIVSLLALVFNRSPFVMMNILFVVFSLAGILEGFIQILFYRMGIRNA